MQVLKEEIKKKILAVAEKMFYKNGFTATTTRSIANEVGISVSNLYLYYENKEAIFYGLTDGFYQYFLQGLETFFNHDDKKLQMETEVSHILQKVMVADRKKFVILAEKSQGTKYEGFKQQFIEILHHHIKEQVNKELLQDDLIIYILSKNLIEGIVEIAKNYKDEQWLKSSMNTLIRYHRNGIEQFM